MIGSLRRLLLAVLLGMALLIPSPRPSLAQQALEAADAVDARQAAPKDVLNQIRAGGAADGFAASPASADDGVAASPDAAAERPRPNADGILAEAGSDDGRLAGAGVLTEIQEPAPGDGLPKADGELSAQRSPFEDAAFAASAPPDDSVDSVDADPQEDAVLSANASAPRVRSSGDNDDDRPYDALGFKLGAFRLYPTLTADTTFDDNVFLTDQDRSVDWVSAVRPSLTLRSQWERHGLEADIAAVRSYHRHFSELDDRELAANLRGQLDVTARGRLEGQLGYSFAQPEQGTLNAPVATGNNGTGSIVSNSATGSYEQRFNRLVGRIGGSVINKDESVAAAIVSDPSVCDVPVPPPECATVQQAYADRHVTLRLGYEIAGGIDVFGEIDGNRRAYAEDEVSLTRRNSTGYTVKLGASFDASPALRGTIALGYAEQTPVAPELAELHGVVVEADIIWVPSALTTVTVNARNGITTTAIDGSIGALENSGRIELRHEFRRYLALRAGLGYTRRDYAGLALSELEINTIVGVDYALDRHWSLLADYTRVDFRSSLTGRDYVDNAFRFGLKVQR